MRALFASLFAILSLFMTAVSVSYTAGGRGDDGAMAALLALSMAGFSWLTHAGFGGE